MNEWQETSIGELGEVFDGPHATPKTVDSGPIFLGIGSLESGRLILQGTRHVTAEDFKVWTRRVKPQKNDFVFSYETRIGQAAIIPDNLECCLGRRMGLVRLNPSKADARYFLYNYISPKYQDYLKSKTIHGATVDRLAIKEFPQFKITLPPLSEQKSIAAVLGALDDKIENNRQMNETLEGMAQAIFKSWFVDFDPVRAKVDALENGGSDHDARLAAMQAISGKSPEDLAHLKTESPESYAELAATAEAFPSTFTDSPLGNIPEGWEVKTIGDCYKVVMGQSPSGETYNEKSQGTLFYQGRAEFGWRFPTPRLYTTDPKRMAEAGDVLMSVRAPVGDMNIAMNDCCVGRGLSALRHECGNTTFSYYQLNSIKSELDRFNGEGTVFGSINQKDLKNISVITPSDPVLKKFIEKCSALDEIISSSSLEIISLAETRDVLLPKLLSGEIDVSNLGDE